MRKGREQKNTPATLDQWELVLSFRGRTALVEPGPSPRFRLSLDDDALAIVAEVLAEYGGLGNARIKTVVYRTEPMKYLLSQERRGRDIRRIPVIYRDKCAPATDPSQK